MKDQHKELAKRVLYYSGYYSLLERLRTPPTPRLLILMYHNVVANGDFGRHWHQGDTPSESQFEAVLATLKKHYRVLSLEDAVGEIRKTGVIQERSAAITFDDGYLSTYTVVFPLLKRYGVPITVYLPTDWIDRKSTPWWLSLAGMIDKCVVTPKLVAEVDAVMGKPLGVDPNAFSDPSTAKRSLLGKLKWDIMRFDDEDRSRTIRELSGILNGRGDSLPSSEVPMTWDQIREMSAHGNRFGAHTCSHPNLSHTPLETAETEIIESKRIIEEKIQAYVDGFAYPYGYDVAGYKRFRPILERHGFQYACTSWCGHVHAASDLFRLGRVGMPQTTSRAIIARTLSLEYCMKEEHPDLQNSLMS